MNFKEFLLDNYIWILVVVLLTVVTIIGFLVDKKRGNKQNKTGANLMPNMGMASVNNGVNVQSNNMDNITPNVGMMQQQQTPQFQVQNMVNQTVPQPVQSTPINQEGFVYQPLSEQTPSFAPQPVPSPEISVNPSFVQPPTPNVIPTPMPMPQQNMNNSFNQSVQSPVILDSAPQQINVIPTPVNQTPVFGPQPMPSPEISANPSFVQPPMSNAMPQVNTNNLFNQNMMPQNNQMPINNNQPVANNNMSPVNNNTIPQFVYGPQNNGQN